MNSFLNKGLFLSIIISSLILYSFYGNILKSINEVYFSISGDGLISYYNSIYHIKYDNSYSWFNGMNYPYGDHVVYVSNQPVISNCIKFISQFIVDISDYTILIINLLMLSSIVVSVIFLFLLFNALNINQYWSLLFSIGITYLSPQLHRMTGHYQLSYIYIIPALLYLLYKFYRKPNLKISLIISVYLFVMGLLSLYNYLLLAFILSIYWLFELFSKKQKYSFYSINISLQILLPYLLLRGWLYFTDPITDRTSLPYGFFVYKSNWEGIFLPNSHISLPIIKEWIKTETVDWEGVSYIGHVASIIYFFLYTIFSFIPFITCKNLYFIIVIVLIGVIIHFILKKRWNIGILSNNRFINILLWIAFISLLISFGFPFLFYPKLYLYTGYFRQFRAIGRFSWIFFYIINISTFYFLYNLKIKKEYVKNIMLAISVIILFEDAFSNNKEPPKLLNNTFKEFDEINLYNIDPKKYQSIIPIPYFHNGSENIWYPDKCNSTLYSIIASLKTGLPIYGSLLSRTSINQTFKSIQPFYEPYRKLEILNDFPNKKPFLIVHDKCNILTSQENYLIKVSSFLGEEKYFNLYELNFDQLERLTDSLYYYNLEYIIKLINEKNELVVPLEDNNNNKFIFRKTYVGDITSLNILYEGTLPKIKDSLDFQISFWLIDFNKDLYSRTIMNIYWFNSSNQCYKISSTYIYQNYVTFDNNLALVEYNFSLQNQDDKIKVTLQNKELLKGRLIIDNLIIKPKSLNIYKFNPNTVFINNRSFYIE